jgi:hypothetical protein
MTEPETVLTMFTIYDSPTNYPGRFVVRRWDIVRGQAEPQPREEVACATLCEARAYVPPGMERTVRDPSDVPCIVETWL